MPRELDVRRERRTVFVAEGEDFADKSQALTFAAVAALDEAAAPPGQTGVGNRAVLENIVANAEQVREILAEYIRLRDLPDPPDPPDPPA